MASCCWSAPAVRFCLPCGLLLVDQARTVLREVKVLKEMASQQGETMSGPLHIGLIPTLARTCCRTSFRCCIRPSRSWKCICTKRRPISCWLSSTAVSSTAPSALVKESEAFIEVPLFDEPMMLAIYEDHPWANRDRVPMSDLAGESC